MSKTILKGARGFTPLIDAIVIAFGITEAAVFGRMWRYCQMSDGVCRASQETIAKELNISISTVYRSIKLLSAAEYIVDKTPTLKNRPHIYADTGKAMLAVELSFEAQDALVSQNEDEPGQNDVSTRSKRPPKIVEDRIEDITPV